MRSRTPGSSGSGSTKTDWVRVRREEDARGSGCQLPRRDTYLAEQTLEYRSHSGSEPLPALASRQVRPAPEHGPSPQNEVAAAPDCACNRRKQRCCAVAVNRHTPRRVVLGNQAHVQVGAAAAGAHHRRAESIVPFTYDVHDPGLETVGTFRDTNRRQTKIVVHSRSLRSGRSSKGTRSPRPILA
jgi:hypothetical protein